MSAGLLSAGKSGREIRGREVDLCRIRLWLQEAESGVHLIVGPPGIGKTALACSVAGELIKNPSWTILAYSLREHFFKSWGHINKFNCVSLAQMLQNLEEDLSTVRPAVVSCPPNADMGDPITARISGILRTEDRILIILDGLDELVMDDMATARLARIGSQLPLGCHLLLTGRPSILCLDLVISSNTLELKGLDLQSFAHLLRDLGVDGPDEKVNWLHKRVNGLPLVAVLLGKSCADIDEIYERSPDTLFKFQEQLLKSILGALPAKNQSLLKAVLEILAVARESFTIQDLHRFLLLLHPGCCPETPLMLWDLLGRNRVLDLCSPDHNPDLRSRRLELFHRSIQDVLRSHYFPEETNLLLIHKLFARIFSDSCKPFDRRNVVYHALEGFRNDEDELADFVINIKWRRLLVECLAEDWSSSDNLLLLDLVRLFSVLRLSSARQLAQILRPILAEIRSDRLVENTRLDELRRVVHGYNRRPSLNASLKVELDLWPGYFPLFAIERELRANGIELRMAQSSAQKIDLLMAHHVDLIGTTPGCLGGVSVSQLRRCRVLGALNRSIGADQILVNSSKIDVHQGNLVDRTQLRGCTALMTQGSTSHMLLLWFLQLHGVDPSELVIHSAREYLGTLGLASDSEDFDLVSTWEPWAHMIRQTRPSLETVYHSGQEPGLVYDLLVAERERAVSLDLDERLAIMWRLFDQCISERHYLKDGVIKEVVAKYKPMNLDWYCKSMQGVHFFDKEERCGFFEQSNPCGLEATLQRVAAAWQWQYRRLRPEGASKFEDWQKALRELGKPAPHWIARSRSGLPMPLPASSISTYRTQPRQHMVEANLKREVVIELVGSVEDFSRQLEVYRNTFTGFSEEQLRDVILGLLTTHYPGSTAESFVNEGKTDMLLRMTGYVPLIVECKNWNGRKHYAKSLDQLFGYLTWHHNYGILLTFSRAKSMTRIVDAAKDAIRSHASLAQEGLREESSSRFVSHHLHRRDAAKTVEIFHLFTDIAAG